MTLFYPRGTEGARQVLPGIEPGLPEDTDVIRIRSDNRYTTKPLNWLFLMKRGEKVVYMKCFAGAGLRVLEVWGVLGGAPM